MPGSLIREEDVKETVRKWRDDLHTALMWASNVDWKQVHSILDSMDSFLGEGRKE
jgi:hypothetical protein